MTYNQQHRYCLNLANPYKNETLGSFLVVSDESALSFNMWIKEGTAKPQQGGGNQPHKGFKKGNAQYQQQGYQHQEGPQQSRGGHQGGYQGGHQGGYQGGHQQNRGGYQGQQNRGGKGGYRGGSQRD